MDDDRIWEFERSLWMGDAGTYADLVDEECVMVLPQPPHVLTGRDAIGKVSDTPKWSDVSFSKQTISRPQEGLIVIGYLASAHGAGRDDYEAHCTSTIRRLEHDNWQVVQHQQTPTAAISAPE